jgi:hypothetical protein
MSEARLLAIVEMGGYPDFLPLYRRKGYRAEKVHSIRKAQLWLKKHQPEVVVAEFHFDPDLRDRMSTLESLLATLQRYAPEARVIVFIESGHRPRLEKVKDRYPVFAALDYPPGEQQLADVLDQAARR